jgi:site-specific recombinase XerD
MGPTESTISEHTRKAYATDWAHYTRWCRLNGHPALPPSVAHIENYLTDLSRSSQLASSSLRRRRAGIVWNYRQRGFDLEIQSTPLPDTVTALPTHQVQRPATKEAITPQEMRAMLATLPYDLRGLRDRAMLLVGYIGGLRRSEIIGLDASPDRSDDSMGGLEFRDNFLRVTIEARTEVRTVTLHRGTSAQTCPVHSVQQWLHFAKIEAGPVFVRTSRDGKRALSARLNDRHIPRLIKSTVLRSGIRADLPENERLALFSGQSLRAASAKLATADNRVDLNLTRALGF